ncbi:MAG: pyridoxamine 5'-phosphate oxidase family protein [Paracoccaceae bacterium]|jgi:pyridoxamine 5'-phosphate oxidase|nr:pyridoxamine 5'-phosphate oxidase family protein [Paracoccaceae bacterium]
MNVLSLESLLDQSWAILQNLRSAKTSERTITLATVDPRGQPQVCMVVLRSIERDNNMLEFHTDADSLKCASLAKEPKAQILIWRPNVSVQLRISVEIDLYSDDKSRKLWAKVPGPSQISYGKSPPTGHLISAPFDYKNMGSIDKFAVAECAIRKIDFLSLEHTHHRAQFLQIDDWAGQWVSP